MARRLMLQYAKKHRPRRILELGAGTGLVGLALGVWMRTQGCPAEIFLTDYHAVVLENLHYNVTRNGLDSDDVGAHVATLDWQHVYEAYTGELASMTTAQTLPAANQERSAAYPPLTDDHPFDVILAADCIYDPAHPAWIHAVACKYLAPKKPGNAEPELHILVPVRSTHLQELDAVYNAFTHPSSPFHVVCEEQIRGTDDFGPITMHRSAFHEQQGHTVEYKYLVIQRS
ncbi:hypothetical protein MVES_000953 [Malassezia vespertilionis]|uniref:Uncharacterized protein n=2 Tax=Malassezia vespertilionis TaxID=2020962 RepID=A0A2N1JFJ6_9BASI|nr:hypothetical protein MVES_000953 [Malassezia vespertilionis]